LSVTLLLYAFRFRLFFLCLAIAFVKGCEFSLLVRLSSSITWDAKGSGEETEENDCDDTAGEAFNSYEKKKSRMVQTVQKIAEPFTIANRRPYFSRI